MPCHKQFLGMFRLYARGSVDGNEVCDFAGLVEVQSGQGAVIGNWAVGGDGKDEAVVGIEQRLSQGRAMKLNFLKLLLLEAFDQDEVQARLIDIEQDLIQPGVVWPWRFHHQRPSLPGDHQHLVRASSSICSCEASAIRDACS